MNDLVQMVAQFLVTGVSVVVVAAVMPGMRVERYSDAVGFAIVAAVLNVVAWKVLAVLTWPLTILTLGLAGFVINGVVFLVARKVVRGVEISGCLVASIAALLVSGVNALLWHALRAWLRDAHLG